MTQRILGSHPTTEELLEHCETLLETEKVSGPNREFIERLAMYRDRGEVLSPEFRSRLLEIVGLYR